MSDEAPPTDPKAKDGANPAACATQSCPVQQVSVTIALSSPVACPGHLLPITATGTPGGGTFQWTIRGADATLVDSTATASLATGPTVNLLSFKADDVNGNVPAQTAVVDVTYTHPNGTANASKPVPIHGVDFDVTQTTITKGTTRANESAGSIQLGNAPGVATMSTDPQVKIKLGACPRKAACAANHKVGWFQTVLTNQRDVRYSEQLVQVTVPLPIRDSLEPDPAGSDRPYYGPTAVFANDGDTKTAHHEDSPGQPAAWQITAVGNNAAAGPVNQPLRRIDFSNGFAAWLAVKNIEQDVRTPNAAYIFVRNFTWSMQLNVTIDLTKPVGSRAAPQSHAPTISAMAKGKGGTSPNLANPVANTTAARNNSVAPVL